MNADEDVNKPHTLKLVLELWLYSGKCCGISSVVVPPV